MRKNSGIVIGSALAAVLVLSSCGGGGATSTQPPVAAAGDPVTGGTLVYASGDAEPTCLDPHVGGYYPQALISTQYLEPLFARDAEGQILGWLAESWQESADQLSWNITLKPGITFTDGTPLTAEAIKVNIAHLKDPETASSTGYLAVGKVTEVEVISDLEAVVHLSAPDSALLDSLSQQWTAIQSPAALERSRDDNCQSPVGTGPFVVDSWVPQQQVNLVRNENYAGNDPLATNNGAAYLDGITWRFIPDAATRQAALQSGEVHVVDNPQPAAIAEAQNSDTISHLDAPRPGSVNRIELNSAQAPFDDIAVREAFIRAADPNPGIESLYFGTTTRSYSPLSSVEPYAYSDESLFNTDLDEANSLLDGAGWTQFDDDGYRIKDGQRLTVRVPVSTNQSVPAEQSLFEQIQANVKRAGFEVILTPVDLSSWYGALAAYEYEAVSAPYTKVGADVLRILYHSDSLIPAPSGYFANLSGLNSPALDELLTQAASEADPTARGDIYRQVQQEVLEGFYILPLYDQQNHFLTRGVAGVRALGTVATATFLDAHLQD